jgi:hypothetical protein
MNVQGPAMRLLPLLVVLAGCGLPASPLESDIHINPGPAELVGAPLPEGESLESALANQPPLPVTHGAMSRARSDALETRLTQILKVVQPEIDSLQANLRKAVDSLGRPERLATTDPVLKTWHAAERDNYQKSVGMFYDEAAKRLGELRDATVEAAAAQARTLASARGPMDAGATGDPALDSALQTFNEVVDGVIDLSDLNVHRSQDLERRTDLFEAFTSFGQPAEATMVGRILLYVGGDETDGVPRALLAFRVDDDRKPGSLHIEQVLRHRILRGNTEVKDLGWRLAPFTGALGTTGRPATEVLENVLVAPRVEPLINKQAATFDQLRDMRIQCDVQSGVFDGDKLLGGMDWRIEFVVSTTGELSWQLTGGKPIFDANCVELMQALGKGK